MSPDPAAVDWHGGPDPWFRLAGHGFSLFLRLALRLRIVGAQHVPATGPALLAANHLSYLDPLVVGVAAFRHGRSVRFFAVEAAFRHRILGPVMRATRMIPVWRGLGPERGTVRVREALAAGEVVVVYPEGTIPAPGTQPAARPGPGLIAARCDVPIIPVATWGVQRGRGWRQWLPRQPAAIVIGEPLDRAVVVAAADEGYQAASEHILAAVRALVPVAREVAAGQRRLPRRRRRAGVSA